MTTPDIQQAKEWARDNIKGGYFHGGDRTLAAAEVIQSLPDIIVDGDKLRQIIDFQGTSISEEARKDLESLLAPSLPTLADMTPEERGRCQWMQARLDRGTENIIIVSLNPMEAWVMWDNGTFDLKAHDEVIPLPDLPKLEWPGSHADTITAESVEDVQAGRIDDIEPALPRPEDVPEGEVWLIRPHENADPVPAFRVHASKYGPGKRWAHYVTGASTLRFEDDEDITLVSRLVPEVAS